MSVSTERQSLLNHTLKEVRRLVQAGFAIHRLHPKSKAPIGDDWSTRAVLSFNKLDRSYRKGENLGARTGEYSQVGGGCLHVIDLDIRAPARAAEARAKLAEMFPEWESLPSVISGSGGSSRHLYLITDIPFPSKKLAHSAEKITGEDGRKHWAWEIELFGTGKQVAIPPSIHPDTGKPYRWERAFDFDNLELGIGPYIPSKRIEILVGEQGAIEYDDERSAPLGLDDDEIRGILADIPQATYCDDRDGWLNVGMALHHETHGSDKGFELWCEFSKRSEKFDARDQKRVWKSFKGKGKPLRMATLLTAAREARFEREIDNLDEFEDLGADEDEVAATDDTDMFADLLGDGKPAEVSNAQRKLNKAEVEKALGHIPPKVKRINKKHAVAFINGKTVIITENRDGTVSYGTVGDLHNYYENDRVAKEDGKTEPVTKYWLRHKSRREYPNGVVFAPGEETEGAYNHWRGFAVEPDAAGSCRLIISHIKKVLCRGDEASWRYLLGWLAHMIQFPGEKPGVAVVIRGLKGTGKDTLGDYVGSLFPTHHVKIASQDQLVGRFNAHQEKVLLLHVEEGFWAGSKQAESQLKHLITSEKMTIEPKGLNAFSVRSVLRLFISSNEKWVVPATGDERRYFVLDTSPEYSLRQASPGERKRYFNAIRHEMKHGGQAAFLHFLQTYDLSDFDVRDVPNTVALDRQKLEGLPPFEEWWFEKLQTGELTCDLNPEEWTRVAQRSVASELLDDYQTFARGRRYGGETLNASRFGVEIAKICNADKIRARSGSARPYVYVIPALPICRAEFVFHMRLSQNFTWPRIWDESPVLKDIDEASQFNDILQ